MKRSLRKKLSIVIVVLMLVTILFFIVSTIVMSQNILNSDSNSILQLSARYYACELQKDPFAGPERGYDTEKLREYVASLDIYGTGNAFLMTEDGDLIYQEQYPNGISAEEMSADEREYFQWILGMERDTVHLQKRTPDNLLGKVILEDLENGLVFCIAVPRLIISTPLRRLFGYMLTSSLVILVLSILAGVLWVRSIVRPLTRMTEVADHYASGDYHEKMEVERQDEVGRLSRSLQTMSESLMHQIEIADSANRAKSAFLSNMSHEIRTPITAVLGFNEMILREADDKDILLYAENVKASGNVLLGLINDVLDFSKIEAGKLEIIPVDYDLSSMLNDLVNMVRVRAEEKGLSLMLDFDRQIPRILNGDEVRIKQIITNILTNAVKYTEQGSVSFTVGYEDIEEEPGEVMLHVTVSDTGIGIREEDIRRIFSEFERVDEKRNRSIEGTGLGMSITQSLLKMMGSSLKVESIYGAGSVFSFVLRQKVVKRDPLGDYQASYTKSINGRERYQSRFTARNARILMVDDNVTNLLVFRSLVKQTLVKVDTAESGDDALSMCGDEKYDIIFLDHMMPHKDGIETLHELKEMKDSPNADTPIISLTANAVSGAREVYIREGFSDYLTKPIDPEKLEEMMMAYLPKDKIDEPGKGVVIEFAASQGRAESGRTAGLSALMNQGYIDLQGGISHCGSKEIYMEILGSFYEQIDETSEALNRFLREDDIENYVIKVHAVKSTSRTIGADALGERAALLERAGRDGDRQYITANHEAFLAEYRKVRRILAKVFDPAD
ncbi:MAG: response regulator [Lachnospiraceae bacterium]|nr:response regulator [Lachnospiraceae bacterium]